MIAELKKLSHSRILVLLLVFCVLFNGYLFRRECLSCTEYSFSDISEMYRNENLQELSEAYQKKMNELILSGDSEKTDGEDYITGHLYSDYHLLNDVLERKNTIGAYSEYLESLIDETEIRLDAGLFGDENSFENRNMRRAVAVYEELRGTETDDTFHGTPELFNRWHISDLFTVVLAVSFAIVIMSEDDRKGMRILLNTLKKGKEDLYMHKVVAVFFCVLISAVLIYGSDYMISAHYVGTGNMNASVQSVYGMQAFPYSLSVWQYLYLWFIWKIFVLFLVSSVMILLSILLKSTVMTVLTALLGTVVSFAAGHTTLLSIRLFSIKELFDIYGITNGYICLNIFSHPVPRWLCAVILCLTMLALLLYSTRKLFIHGEITAQRSAAIPIHHTGLTSSLFWNEGIKVFLFQNGFLILLILIICTVGMAHMYSPSFGQFESSYYSASLILDGKKSEEKDQYIIEKRKEFDELNNRLIELIQSGFESAMIISADIEQQLQTRTGFEKAVSQYEALPDDGVYIYSTGYEELFGREGIRRDLLNMAAGILAVCLIFSGIHSREYETNMISLIRAYGKEAEINSYKLRSMLGICLVITLCISLPQYIRTANIFGFPHLSESCSNLLFLSGLPSFISIGLFIVMILILRYLIISIIACAVSEISERIKDSSAVLIFSSLVFALPFLIIHLLM